MFLLALVFLLESCYTYKNLDVGGIDYKVGKKYEIKVGDHLYEKVILKEITDSTLVVAQKKNEIVLQRSLITEVKPLKITAGSIVMVGILTVGMYVGIGAIFFNELNNNIDIY